jgi:hypothetical protein
VKTFDDVVSGKAFTVGTMAPGSTIYDTPAIINAALNAQMKLVRGFEGVATIVATEARWTGMRQLAAMLIPGGIC